MNMFQENTYILYDETKECVIIDPGCYYKHEQQRLARFVEERKLRPVALLNTHCHLDHVFGNAWVAKTYGLGLQAHAGERPVLERLLSTAQFYGIPNVEASPPIETELDETQTLSFGQSQLEIRFTPGHSPASLCFYAPEAGFIIGGDVLFEGSIGRTDLPGGNHATLIHSIKTQLLTLPEATKVYPGHGQPTDIGTEKRHNPFLR